MRQKQTDIIVASVRSFSSRLIAPSVFDGYSLQLTKGDEISQELLVEHLFTAGYLRQEPVGAPGEFSIRGGIVDIFSPLMAGPIRVEFFGDSVDSLREFDLDDQRSRGPIQRLDIVPMQDLLISRELLREWSRVARDRWKEPAFQKDLSEKTMFAANGELFPGAPFLIPAVSPLEATLLDYAESPVVIFDEPDVSKENHESFFNALEQRYAQTVAAGGLALQPRELVMSPADIAQLRERHQGLSLERLG
jgi:transcription-repair coupling factor (superfamily II helicase)